MNEGKSPIYEGNNQSQLFELDRVELAFYQLLVNQGLPAQHTRDLSTNVTPRIELQLSTDQIINHWRIATGDTQSQFMVRDAWNFTLASTVVTNREQNGDSHIPLIGLARWNMQMAQMLNLWTLALCPTHQIIDIREESGSPEVWDEGGCDYTKLTFTGMFNIRPTAW